MRHYQYSGKCGGTTKAGNPCKHMLVCAKGLCLQHGGDTPKDINDYIPVARAAVERDIASVQRLVNRSLKMLARAKRRHGWRTT